MAAKEIYDYVDVATPDYDYTLTIAARGTVVESALKNQVLYRADNFDREVVSITDNVVFFLEWDWNILSEAESGTILELYVGSSKANGRANSFRFSGHDGHTYVVCFDCDLVRSGQQSGAWGIPKVRLEVIGRIAD